MLRRWHASIGPCNLQCWQVAHEIRREVIAICANERLARDLRFCDGFRDAAGSVCRNIAEGFARYESGQIAQFFGYALASVAEVKDGWVEIRARGIINAHECERLVDRCEHARALMLNFIRPHLAKTRRNRRDRPNNR